MLKRILKPASLVLAVLITLLLFSGCTPKAGDVDKGSDNNVVDGTKDKGTPSSDEQKQDPIDVSMFLMDFAPSPDEFVITKIIKEKFNINMKWEINPYDGFFDKLNVMISSDELPDLIAPIPIDQAKDVGTKGALVPFNQYLDKMPNLNQLFSQSKVDYASSMASDGNIYAVPAFQQKMDYRYVPTIRKDLLDETGLAIPKNFEELYNVLKAIKDKNPDNIGIVNMDKADVLNDYGTNFNTRTEVFYDETQDKFVYAPLNDGYEEMIIWFSKMWNDKLLDSEFFTAAQKQWEDKVMSGKAAFWLSWSEYAYKYEKNFKDIYPDSKFDTVPIMPLVSNFYDKQVVQGMPQVNTWTTIAISSKSKYVDRLIPFVDWMYSEEGSTALQFGVEGETYNIVDNKKKYSEHIKADYNPDATTEQNVLGIGPGGNLLIRIIREDEFEQIPDYKKDVNAVIDQYRQNNYYSLFNKGMSLTFTEEQLDELARYQTDIKTYVQEESIKFITGLRPLNEYGNFKAELVKRGSDTIESIYAEAYNAFKENMKNVK